MSSATTAASSSSSSSSSSSGTAQQHHDEGNKLVKAGNFADAIPWYDAAIELEPTAARYGNRSLCHSEVKLFNQALKDAESSIALDPNYEKAYFRKIDALFGLKRYDDALAVCSDRSNWKEHTAVYAKLSMQAASALPISFLDGTPLRVSYEKYVIGEKKSLSKQELAQLKNVTYIPSYFLSAILDRFMPSRFKKVKSVDLSMFGSVRTVGLCFLTAASALTSIDLAGLSNVRGTLPDAFLGACDNLTRIDNMSALSNVTALGAQFLSQGKSLKHVDIPLTNVTHVGNAFLRRSSVTSVDLSALANLTSIDEGFLVGSSITSVDLSSLVSLTSVGEGFLAKSAITSVDLSGLRNVTSISRGFLSGCTKLTSVDLGGFAANSSQLTLGEGFLAKCTGLTNIKNMGVAISTLTHVDDHFVSGCSSLLSVDLSGLKNVTSVGAQFLEGASALTSIDLAGLSNVRGTLPDGFLSECDSLTRIDNMSALSNVTALGAHFLSEGKSLKHVDIPLTNVTHVGRAFLYRSSVTSVDLSGLRNLTSIACGFLGECTKLTSVDLGGFAANAKQLTLGEGFFAKCTGLTNIKNMDVALSTLTHVDDHFVRGCSSLLSVDLSGLKHVTSVGAVVLARATSLTSVDLAGLSQVSSIGSHFLQECTSLTTIKNMKALSNVTCVGESFLFGCSSLTRIDVSCFTNLEVIDDFFLAECSSLKLVDNMSALSRVKTVGRSFFAGCEILEPSCIDLTGFTNVKKLGDCFLFGCPELSQEKHLDQVDLRPLLHLKSKNIDIDREHELSDNLRTALQRVRSGGANGDSKKALAASVVEEKAGEEEKKNQQEEKEKKEEQNIVKNSATASSPKRDENDEGEDDNNKNISASSKKKEEKKKKPQEAEKKEEKRVCDMTVAQLCAYLEKKGVSPKITDVLKAEEVAGLEFVEPSFITENEDMFSKVRKTAVTTFRKVHGAEVGSSASSATAASK